MIRLCNRTMHRSLVMLTALVTMLFVVSSCASSTKTSLKSENKEQANHGNVIVFTPSDGLAITRNKPLSTWDVLVPELIKSLKDKGFDDNSITTKTSSSLSEQSRDVQDYVVNLLSSLNNAKQNNSEKHNSVSENSKIKKQLSKTTIVIAPWTNKNGNNNYGDYATLPASNSENTQKSNTQDLNLQNDDNSQSSKDELNAEKRLASSLSLAKKAGIHVVMLSRRVSGFKPDVMFHLSDARTIGEIQATTLVQKIALDRATKENPRYIEVLLPCHNQKNINANNNNQQNNSDEASEDDDSNNNTHANSETAFHDDFAEEAFAGIWKVLRPYFASGTLISTSGRLNVNSSEKDWTNVAFDADVADSVKNELTKRITRSTSLFSHSRHRVDGIIALDDQIALQAVQALNDLGYEGSAADINPSFNLPDVIGNFIGKRDLNKRPVPAPKDSAKKTEKELQQQQKKDEEEESEAKKWPVITGYGAYKNIMPNIVSGKQWMTTIENHKQIVQDLTATCYSLNRNGKLDKKIATVQTKIEHGETVPTVNERLVAVSATNLKSRLIDPGYVSLADAGL